MSRFFAHLFLGLALMAAGSARAADLDYNWLSGGAIQDDPSGGGSDSMHGYYVDGSYALSSHFTLEGTYYRYSSDTSQCFGGPPCGFYSRAEHYTLLGAGWHTSVGDSTDLLVDVYHAQVDIRNETGLAGGCPFGWVTTPGACVEDSTGSGYQVDVGLRLGCDCNWELKPYVGHINRGAIFGSEGMLGAEADWKVAAPWTLILDARHLAGSEYEYRLGLRYFF